MLGVIATIGALLSQLVLMLDSFSLLDWQARLLAWRYSGSRFAYSLAGASVVIASFVDDSGFTFHRRSSFRPLLILNVL